MNINKKNIKNFIGLLLVGYGSYLVLRYMSYVNGLDDMGGPMCYMTNGLYGTLAVVFGTIYLLVGKKLSYLSLHWVFRIVFMVSLFWVLKNMWLYSYVPYELILHSHKTIYPTLENDGLAVFFLLIYFMNSFTRPLIKRRTLSKSTKVLLQFQSK